LQVVKPNLKFDFYVSKYSEKFSVLKYKIKIVCWHIVVQKNKTQKKYWNYECRHLNEFPLELHTINETFK